MMGIEALGRNPNVNGFEMNLRLQADEHSRVEEAVNNNNKSLEIDGRKIKQQMDKNDFLTLLITQLKNQDPMNPVEDKQFIAQMAQFSQLEQMNNMSTEFKRMAGMMSSGQAFSVLGKTVDVQVGDKTMSGVVSEVTSGDFPNVRVNGTFYDYKNISSIRQQ